MNIRVSEAFDRAVVTWVGSVANEFMKQKATGSFEVISAVEGDDYSIKVNGQEILYTAQAGDTTITIAAELTTLLEASSIASHIAVTTTDSIIAVESIRTLYYLYIEEEENAQVIFTPGVSVVVLWTNQNAFDPTADEKPMDGNHADYPFITISPISNTEFGKETLIVKDKGAGFDNRVDNTVTLRFGVTTLKSYGGMTDYIAGSYSRRTINRLFLRPNGVTCFGTVSKNDMSFLLNSMTELRYALDMRFNYVTVVNESDEDVGLIETININGHTISLEP